MNFLNRIRQLRDERNMTQSELAILMNTNYQTISDYEREKYYPGIELLRLLAHHFNTSIDYLLCETDVRDPYMSAREHYLTPKESELVLNFRKLDSKSQNRLLGIALGMTEALDENKGYQET